jgi:hypothetical protein
MLTSGKVLINLLLAWIMKQEKSAQIRLEINFSIMHNRGYDMIFNEMQ